jgi:hypothetical protein
MKITKEIWECGILMQIKEFNDVPSAVEDAVQSNVELSNIVARLIDTAFGEASYRYKNIEKLSYILGSGYEVEE